MKLLLVFALFGITCCLAVPFCSKEHLSKCFGPPGPSGSEEDELNKICKQTKCFVNIYDRCGTDIFGLEGAIPLKGYHKVIDNFCHNTPLRRKYLENVECLKKFAGGVNLPDLLNKCDIKDRPREEFCRKIPAGMQCATEYVVEKCGRDAGDVFRIGALPYFDPYDCLS